MELSAALGIPFGAAGWLALLLHTFAIECYVSTSQLRSIHETHPDAYATTAATHTQRIQSFASSILRTSSRTRHISARIRRLDRREIR
jgi:hypothetical protein